MLYSSSEWTSIYLTDRFRESSNSGFLAGLFRRKKSLLRALESANEFER